MGSGVSRAVSAVSTVPKISPNGKWITRYKHGCIATAAVTRVDVFRGRSDEHVNIKIWLRGNNHGYQEYCEFEDVSPTEAAEFVKELSEI